MSQCVPGWELDGRLKLPNSQSNSLSLTPNVPTSDYEVAELTWENGNLSMHGLGQPRVVPSTPKYMWEKTCVGGTLESIVDQATLIPNNKLHGNSNNEVVPWFINNQKMMLANTTTATTKVITSVTGVVDALVPCTNMREGSSMFTMDSGFGTHVESCSGATVPFEKARTPHLKVPVANKWSICPENSVSESATFCKDSRQLTVDTSEMEFGAGRFTSTSMGSPENTSSGKQCTGEDHDSVCHSKRQRATVQEQTKKKSNGKSSLSAKRTRAAAVHNQSERKRRDKINQKMKTLQKLVPNSSKTDKASMLDEVIEYLKQLQAQVNMMNRMNMSPMMLPFAMQQQLQMQMMGMGLGMGMGMGHVMDINTALACRPNMAAMSPAVLHPSTFISSLNPPVDHRLQAQASIMQDPMATFLAACQSQPMTMDAYSRMAALYQQLQQNPGPGTKN